MFVGRRAEFQALDEATDPVVVVCGPPGIGKTAVLAHWAALHRLPSFIIRRDSTPWQVLSSLSRQLAERFNLPFTPPVGGDAMAWRSAFLHLLEQLPAEIRVVVDGVDGADYIPMPPQLPATVRLVLSAREAPSGVKVMQLGPLRAKDVQRWLNRAHRTEDVEAVMAVTGGHPLKLRRLLAGDFRHVPKDEAALLSAALAPVSEEMVAAILGHPLSDATMPWLSEDRRGLSLFHESLREGLDLTEARARLLDYCSRWREHRDPYALRQYPWHLAEGGQSDTLYRLAADRTFWDVQKSVLPNQPELGLRTVQAAIGVAADCNDMARTIEMVRLHRRRVVEMTQQSALARVRDGELDVALELADLHTGWRRTVYLQLIAWERAEQGEAVDEILERAAGSIGDVSDEAYLPHARGLLAALPASEPLYRTLSSLPLLARRRLKEGGEAAALALGDAADIRVAVVEALVEEGDTERALAVADGLEPVTRRQALGLVANQFRARGDWDTALKILKRIDDAAYRQFTVRAMALSAAHAGHIDKAVDLVQTMVPPEQRASVLYPIARKHPDVLKRVEVRDSQLIELLAQVDRPRAVATCQALEEQAQDAAGYVAAGLAWHAVGDADKAREQAIWAKASVSNAEEAEKAAALLIQIGANQMAMELAQNWPGVSQQVVSDAVLRGEVDMARECREPGPWNQRIGQLIFQGDVAAADAAMTDAAEALGSGASDVLVHGLVASARRCMREGAVEDAQARFAQALEHAGRDVHRFEEVIGSMAESDLLDDAVAAVSNMPDDTLRAAGWRTLGQHCVRIGSGRRARDMYESALLTDALQEPPLRGGIYPEAEEDDAIMRTVLHPLV